MREFPLDLLGAPFSLSALLSFCIVRWNSIWQTSCEHQKRAIWLKSRRPELNSNCDLVKLPGIVHLRIFWNRKNFSFALFSFSRSETMNQIKFNYSLNSFASATFLRFREWASDILIKSSDFPLSWQLRDSPNKDLRASDREWICESSQVPVIQAFASDFHRRRFWSSKRKFESQLEWQNLKWADE